MSETSTHTHIHDPEGHVTAVETDFEYFRRKRLESRVLHFLRRGIITFADLLRADSPIETPVWADRVWKDADAPIRYVEDQLDELNRTVWRQQQEIELLREQVRELARQLKAIRPADPLRPEDEIPPHW